MVDTVLYDNSQLQLKAESPWEALDWGQKLWEVVHAAVPNYMARQGRRQTLQDLVIMLTVHKTTVYRRNLVGCWPPLSWIAPNSTKTS